MLNEIWKPIPLEGYADLYEVSSLGQIRSVDRIVKCNTGYRLHKGQILKPSITRSYRYITLSKNQKLHSFRICRLVAKAFVPNPDSLPCVNHKDECKTNDVYTNLEWVDWSTNANYGARNEKIGNKQRRKRIICLETGEIFPSLMSIQRTKGYSHNYISMVCRGLKKTAYGHHWEFIN